MPSLSIASALPRGLFRFDIVKKAIVGIFLTGLLTQAAHAVAFQWYRDTSNCPNQTLCDMDFPVVAANRAVAITSVSCSILIGTQTVEILQASINIVNAGGQTTVQDSVVPVLLGKNGLGSWFSFNHQTLLALSSGFKLRARVSTDAISSMILQCKAGGDIRVVN